jgi:hypothetical protein
MSWRSMKSLTAPRSENETRSQRHDLAKTPIWLPRQATPEQA